MSCEEFQKRLLAGEVSKKEQNEHLNGCPECRKYAAVLSAVETPAISTELDMIVRENCLRDLRGNAFRVQKRRHVFAPALAAALALALMVWALMGNGAAENNFRPADTDSDIAFEAGIAIDEAVMGALEFELELLASGM